MVDRLKGNYQKHVETMEDLKDEIPVLEKKGIDVEELSDRYKELEEIKGTLEQELKDAEQKLASLESKPAPAKETAEAPAPAEEPETGGGKKSRIKKSRRKKSRKSKRRKRNSKKKKTYKRRR